MVAELAERFGLKVHAFVLMDNHYHLVVRTPEPNLSEAMRWLHVSYAVISTGSSGESCRLSAPVAGSLTLGLFVSKRLKAGLPKMSSLFFRAFADRGIFRIQK
jgi:hypothetical protein